MRTSLFLIGRAAVVVLPLMGGCVSMRPGPAALQRKEYGPAAFARIRDSLSLRRVSEASDAAEVPHVRIIPFAGQSSDYVDATVRVTQDAYVLVLATDLDGRVRVVFPESPEQSGFVSASAPQKIPKFFSGFGPLGSARYGRSAFSVEPVNRFALLGTMVAIASDQPLQLARISDRNGDWNEAALERLVYGRSATSVGYALGAELSVAGQGFDADYSGFNPFSSPSISAYASVGSQLCESGFTNALYYDSPRTTFFERDGIRYAMTTTGSPCTGYQSRTIEIGPATPLIPRDSADSARVRGADPRFAAAQAREARSRFRPSESLRVEPGQRNIDGELRGQTDNDRDRARVEAAERNSRRPMTPTEQRPMPEPMRREPPQVREAPMAAPAAPREAPMAAPATPSDASSGKPRKE
jgi:hypothetical protein